MTTYRKAHREVGKLLKCLDQALMTHHQRTTDEPEIYGKCAVSELEDIQHRLTEATKLLGMTADELYDCYHAID